MTSFDVSFAGIGYFYPLFVMGIAGFLILFLGTIKRIPALYASITFGAMLLSIILIAISGNGMVFGYYVHNGFTEFFSIIFIISSMFIVYPALKALREKEEIFYALLLFVTIGMIVAAFSYNLVVLFIAFEAVSIGTYLISGFHKTRKSLESSIKYFFTGTVSTAFIVFGLSYFYLSYGTFNILSVTDLLSKPSAIISAAFLVIGFGFKLALFPMHQWAIDTYDGTENSVSAFLSTGSKLVAFLIILKIFIAGFLNMGMIVFYFFLILSIVSMTYANIAALSQRKVKRILAYSSVAQAGYLVLAVVVSSYAGKGEALEYAVAAGMYYSLVYIFMKAGSFLTMDMVKKSDATLDDMAGLAKESPTSAASFSVLLLALAGVPLTGGFLAKFYLFLSLFQGDLWWLGIIAVINSSISVFYYFRIMIYMYTRENVEKKPFDLSLKYRMPLYISALVVLFLGIYYPLFNIILPNSTAIFGGL